MITLFNAKVTIGGITILVESIELVDEPIVADDSGLSRPWSAFVPESFEFTMIGTWDETVDCLDAVLCDLDFYRPLGSILLRRMFWGMRFLDLIAPERN